MEIQTLPLLPSDWVQWSWESSNGTATSLQKQTAYDALENKRLCELFLRFVWNDLVTLLSNTLEYAGITWDSTYGDVSSCHMSINQEGYVELTARAFNAMVLNINQLNIFRWTWERTNNLPGFLGRTYVKGFADCGGSSDLVYGWYIIELAERLNHLITILKNEADFSEFEPAVQGVSEIHSSVAVPRAGVLDFAKGINAEYLAAVVAVPIIEQSSQVKGFSYHNGIIVPRKTRLMTALEKGNSQVSATTAKLKAEAMQSAAKASTISGSILTGMVFIGYLRHDVPSVTQTKAILEASNICIIDTLKQAQSEVLAKIVASSVWLMGTQVHGDSYASSDLIMLEGLQLGTMCYADSYSKPEISVMDKVLMTGAKAAKSMQNSTLQYFVPRYIKKDIYAVTIPKAYVNIVTPFPVMTDSVVNSFTESKCDIGPVVLFEWTGKETSLTDAIVRAVQMLKMEAVAGGESIANGTELIYCDGVRLDVQSEAKSMSQGTIQKGIPKIAEAAEKAQTTELGDLVALPKRSIKSVAFSCEIGDAEVVAAGAKFVSSACAAGTTTDCVLELEYNSHSAWKDPVQNGGDVYIRNVYPQWQEGSNVHVDSSGEFYEPVQTDGNVYIRSNESMKGW